ncbi:MAG TPA: nucleoid-associated protein [Ferruginibacter sp.]|nr:nucleoid-associated protein [Ferruginibacter sp.]HRE63983.1 nucleoid-associated protein [Ferruginibacter sp.]
MTGIENVQIKQAIIHRVGNSGRGEDLKLSEKQLTLNDPDLRKMLVKYFLGAINENELYRFSHISNIELNEVYNYVSAFLKNEADFVRQSMYVSQFLYNKSSHVKIKEGELCIVHLTGLPFEGEMVDAIGFYKSESKENFLKVFQHGKSIEIISEEGINTSKPDKACLVFKKHASDGYRVCVIDHTNKQQEAQYWVNDFLQVQPLADSYHHTDKYLSLCKQFVTNEYADKFEVSKSDQLEMLNRSMDYFKTRDHFNMEEFAEEVIHHPEVVDSFMQYKKNYEADRKYEFEENFDIHLSAVKKQQKFFKSVLKLDKNFHIYIHGRRDLIEKGVDDSGRKYYKIYFEEEQ